MPVTVSILLPNLNNRAFLEERIETIVAQTFNDWELIIVDNYSDDGAWEFFQTWAAKDSRIQIAQAPRAGLYANWNNCVRKANGKYVYIATSDDTMPPNCLQEMVSALEAQPQCDLAHCRVRLIDRDGRDAFDWWSSTSVFAASAGPMLNQEHVRAAPFDGLLHLSGTTVYTSITQLLIRRSVFERVGLFETRWGSIGDFNWCMRASLVSSTVHVPGTWGGWRVYPDQATAGAGLGSAEHSAKMEEMIDDAITRSLEQLAPKVRRPLQSIWLKASRDFRELSRALVARPTLMRRWSFLLSQIVLRPRAFGEHVRSHFAPYLYWPMSAPAIIRRWLGSLDYPPVLQPVSRPPQIAPRALDKSVVGQL